MEPVYDTREVEERWQGTWAAEGVYAAEAVLSRRERERERRAAS
jgi:valyl-tRNA synthetase